MEMEDNNNAMRNNSGDKLGETKLKLYNQTNSPNQSRPEWNSSPKKPFLTNKTNKDLRSSYKELKSSSVNDHILGLSKSSTRNIKEQRFYNNNVAQERKRKNRTADSRSNKKDLSDKEAIQNSEKNKQSYSPEVNINDVSQLLSLLKEIDNPNSSSNITEIMKVLINENYSLKKKLESQEIDLEQAKERNNSLLKLNDDLSKRADIAEKKMRQ
eukprot:CAMPEP_0170526604 /NCGR_PEP_ID=MMETSP0209-20121228/11992_1 /TAXON_ID=665100 ORGANISM="Litonotus pictus, Strain P1" /NCGR_SAMPLE_ID=MMETSP0209 /ASSEMBLY_ACC=CAM_ASM_000301 /LENGTH=212 /DNA_ID=CAMNT_0010816497 /DNA_START=781 /DNA_END=1420 /DNA_ORIENTATION=+